MHVSLDKIYEKYFNKVWKYVLEIFQIISLFKNCDEFSKIFFKHNFLKYILETIFEKYFWKIFGKKFKKKYYLKNFWEKFQTCKKMFEKIFDILLFQKNFRHFLEFFETILDKYSWKDFEKYLKNFSRNLKKFRKNVRIVHFPKRLEMFLK